MTIPGIDRVRRTARRVTNMFVSRAMILLYHRVAELPQDPQLLCVSPSHFIEHLQVIRRWGRTIQLGKLDQVLQGVDRRRHMIIVTFDDGYADNFYNAKPLLERYDVPATVFVATGYLRSKREFWYDELEKIFLHTGPLPDTLRLKINERYYEWELGSDANGGESFSDWNVSRKDDPTVRHCIYRTVFQILHPLPDTERQKILEYLAAWAGMDTASRATHRTLLPQELIRLADGGLVEIGSHTVSHPVLSALPVAQQVDEIARSKACLEEMLGHRVASFAYPFGGRSHYTQETVGVVRDAGFDWACSNFAGMVRPNTDRWQLPRFLVRDWDGQEFAHRLSQWFRS